MGETPIPSADRPEEPRVSAWRRLPWLACFGVAVALSTTVGSVALAGIWDPPELQSAEYGRRIAHDLLGAATFQVGQSEPRLSANELGRGELPFVSIAVGFRSLGLSSWAGRLSLAIWGLLGLAALHFGVRRLATPRAAWLCVLALSTAPLYFVGSRTLQGDIVTMAAGAFSMMGLAIAVFDSRRGRVRAGALVLALLGLLAGLLSRGLVVGVAVPALGVGLSWLVLACAGMRGDRAADWLGSLSLVGGALAAFAGVAVLGRTPDDVFSFWLGATPTAVRPLPTFDVVVRDVGHAFFPWSALLLPAFARMLNARREAGDYCEQGLRLSLLATALAAFAAQTALARALGLLPFAAPAALAAAAALSLDDFERTEPSRWFGLCVAALLVLLLNDFRKFPEKGMLAFGVSDAVFPARFAPEGFVWLAALTLPLAAAFLLLVQERSQSTGEPGFRVRAYVRWLRIVRRVWQGNLWFGLLFLGSACLLLELLQKLSAYALHVRAFESMTELSRGLVRAGWVCVLLLVLGPPLVSFARDALRALLALPERVRPERARRFDRGVAALLAFAVSGTLLSFGYHTALARELSPKSAFDRYRREAPAGAPLALLGVSASVARYQAGTPAKELGDADAAAGFLLGSASPRYLVLRVNDLAGVNAVFRAASTPRRNLPVLDSHSTDIALASNRLLPGQRDDNPFARSVLAAAPAPQHPLDVDLGGKLTVLGWDMFDSEGARVSAIRAGVEYEFATYYRVDQRMLGNWDTFLHIDGFQRRFNGDHATLAGHYPFPLWLVGDFMVDRHRVRLGPEFSRGTYRVLFGLYSGSRRLEVRRGDHEDDRIVAGSIEVK